MTPKVEVLNQQLRESQERFSAMHQRMTSSGGTAGTNGKQPGEKYEDVLKEQILKLEAELAVQRAKSSSNNRAASFSPSPSEVRKAERNPSGFQKQEHSKLASELSECNDLLGTVQQQVDRVYKQLEQLENSTGSSTETNPPSRVSPVMSRYRGAKSASSATDEKAQILKDVAQMKSELDSLKNNLKKRKSASQTFLANGIAKSEATVLNGKEGPQTVAELEEKCYKQEKSIAELREQLELAQQDKESARQESAAATERLLQTEERWNKELDRLRESYETQDDPKEEKASLLKERNSSLNEKTKKVTELEARVAKQESELKTRHKDIQEKLDVERKKARDFETKYQKLEELYETDREKLTLVMELNQLTRKVETDAEEFKREKTAFLGQLEQKSKDVEFRLDEVHRMKKETEMLKSRIDDQKQQLEETRKARDDAREELSRWQQTWARERSELAHKLRQEGKVQQAEHQALQLKYESRIKVMEESSKRFQSQLTQTRRERDQHRDALAMTEKKLTEMRQRYETEEKETQQKMQTLEKQAGMVADIITKLEKEQLAHNTLIKNYEADQRLWKIEKEQLTSNLPKEMEQRLNEVVKISEDLRKQIDEMKKSYDKEVEQLRKNLEKYRHESSKEKSDLQRKLREAQENVKVLEIDRRNMLSSKDENEMEKTIFQAERDTLMQKLHDTEIHQLANKYKLDKVADQISDLLTKIRYSEPVDSEKREMQETAKKALDQLMTVREDMARTRELGRALDQLDQEDDISAVSSTGSARQSSDGDSSAASNKIGERLAPVGSEAESPVKKSVAPTPVAEKPPTASSGDKPGFKEILSRSTTGYQPYKTRSASSEYGWEARIAEIRLRSPSPSPRKLTNYPEAPPSMILNADKAVEYDKEGKRHWTRKTMIRSISLDPGLPPIPYLMLASTDESSLGSVSEMSKSHNRSSSSGAYNTHGVRGDLSISADLSSREGSPKLTRRRVADIFATLSRTREANVKEKRKLFGVRKSKSVETSDTAQRIGAMGVQTFSPAVPGDALPESLQSSMSTLDTPPPAGVKKSGSGSKLFDKFRRSGSGRSLVAGGAEGQHRSEVKTESPTEPTKPSISSSTSSKTESSPETKPGKLPDSSWIGRGRAVASSRTTSDENVGLKYTTSSSRSRYTTLNLSRLRTSYSFGNIKSSVSNYKSFNQW